MAASDLKTLNKPEIFAVAVPVSYTHLILQAYELNGLLYQPLPLALVV